MSERPTVGSLFAGIGGLDLGLEHVGFTVRWQVEIDPFCRAVLHKHWPHVVQWGDVREVGAHNLERVDCICGGFPCQDLSIAAGLGDGLDGSRSGLWSEFVRLLGDLRPRVVVVENVAALLVRGLDRVLADLAGLGFDAEWSTVRAADLGAPHRRERLFIVAYAECSRLEGRERGVVAQSGERGSDTDARGSIAGARGTWHGWPARPDARPYEYEPPRVHRAQPGMGVDPHGFSRELVRDRRVALEALGNAVVPHVAAFVGRRALERLAP